MTRIINITGNSGSGKSFLALNLGIALTKCNHDVLLVDSNIYSPDIGNYSDISPGIFLNEFMNGERKIEETITKHPSGMKMIMSMPEDKFDPVKHSKMNEALLSLIGKSEIILVDSFSHNPAMNVHLQSADENIFVMNDDYPSVAKSKDLIKSMEGAGHSVIGAVLNRKRKDSNASHVESLIEKRILAEIPHDEKIIDSMNMRQPLLLKHSNSDAAKSIMMLARLIGHKNAEEKKEALSLMGKAV